MDMCVCAGCVGYHFMWLHAVLFDWRQKCMTCTSGGNFPLPEAGADCEVPQGYRMVGWNNLEGQRVEKEKND